MKNLSLVFAAALSLAAFGCKKKGGADCDKAIANSMEVSKADMAKMGVDDKMMAKMRALGVQHCKDDKWPDDSVKCMADAKTEADAQGCYGKMSADQKEKMNKAMMELMTPPGGDMGAGSAAGSAAPATGSDTAGSAAAGSDTGAAGSAAAGSAAPAAGSAAPAAGSAAAGSAGSAAAPK